MQIRDIIESIKSPIETDIIYIEAKIKEIEKFIHNFDTLVRVNGYQNTVNAATPLLTDIPLISVLLEYSALQNIKVRKTYDRLIEIRSQLSELLNSGLSYE